MNAEAKQLPPAENGTQSMLLRLGETEFEIRMTLGGEISVERLEPPRKREIE